MVSIAHVVNPVKVDQASSLFLAQPITFETMRIARKFARDEMRVEQYAAVFPADVEMVPESLIMTKLLERSILDFQVSDSRRKLPLIKDILDRVFDESDADYLLYTNVDIALLPQFYVALKGIIEEGYDGFIINRRTINKGYSRIDQIPLMYAEAGETHPGCDCFIFKREIYPKFLLGNVVIGCYFFGLTLRTNLAVFARRFKHFRDLHLTFHMGDERPWRYFTQEGLYNQKELETIFPRLMNTEEVNDMETLVKLHQEFSLRRQRLIEKNERNEPF